MWKEGGSKGVRGRREGTKGQGRAGRKGDEGAGKEGRGEGWRKGEDMLFVILT